ncbi:MAG: hypothetical protein NT154_09260 [Verrucomicrobia bacterium]|nr:hypothetical protein [Verrucomicrobiota bacterium]
MVLTVLLLLTLPALVQAQFFYIHFVPVSSSGARPRLLDAAAQRNAHAEIATLLREKFNQVNPKVVAGIAAMWRLGWHFGPMYRTLQQLQAGQC